VTKAHGLGSFLGSGHVVEEEMRQLKRDLQRLTLERDILKKAIAICSSLQWKSTNS
jgi:hypothetical protein